MNFNKNMNVLVLSADRENSILALKALNSLGIKNKQHLSNGIEAIEKMTADPMDFLVCDVNVQFISGWLFVKEMKLSDKIQNVPVILFGKSDAPVKEPVLKEFGIVKYLKFPKEASDLEFVIHSTLSLFNTSGTVENKYTKAKDALIGERAEDAVELFSELHSLTKKGVRSSQGLAQSYEMNNEVDKAKAVMEELAQSGDDTPSSQVYRIRFMLQDKKFEPAYKQSIGLFEMISNEYYYKTVVSLFLDHRQYEYANTFCLQALEDKGFSLPVFYLGVAKCAYQKEDYDKALEQINKSEKLFGKDGESLNLKGVCLKKMCDYESALHSYEEALKMSPNDFRVYFNLAVCSIEMQSFADAVRYLETCLRINPKFTRAADKLAEIKSKRNVG